MTDPVWLLALAVATLSGGVVALAWTVFGVMAWTRRSATALPTALPTPSPTATGSPPSVRDGSSASASDTRGFVNIARRNQTLLGRQLALIDSLERDESDPDALASLYSLDHLATRMRRNAESLLVLAGVDGGRRLREPIELSDVLRTAAGEIEQYERVGIDVDDDPLLVAHAVLPTAHLVAEIMENATQFSQGPVTVTTAVGEDGAVSVEVVDTGLGMTDEEVAAALDQIHGSHADDLAAEARLGFHVVGRLARRLGARVAITSVPHGGTRVQVTLPASLIEPSAPSVVAPVTPQTPAPAIGSVSVGITAPVSVPRQVSAPDRPLSPTVLPHGLDMPRRRRDRPRLPPGSSPAAAADPADRAAVFASFRPTTDVADGDAPVLSRRARRGVPDAPSTRSAVASQALSELSMLSTYRPAAHEPAATPLQRRDRASEPAAATRSESKAETPGPGDPNPQRS